MHSVRSSPPKLARNVRILQVSLLASLGLIAFLLATGDFTGETCVQYAKELIAQLPELHNINVEPTKTKTKTTADSLALMLQTQPPQIKENDELKKAKKSQESSLKGCQAKLDWWRKKHPEDAK